MKEWNDLTLLNIFHLKVEAWYEDAHSLRAFTIQQFNDLKQTKHGYHDTLPVETISESWIESLAFHTSVSIFSGLNASLPSYILLMSLGLYFPLALKS